MISPSRSCRPQHRFSAVDLSDMLDYKGPDEPAKRPPQRLYLLSGQLSEKLRAPASFKGVGPRSKEVARLEKALLGLVPKRACTSAAHDPRSSLGGH